MKNILVFHPSNELYGADRILVNALQSFPEEDKKTVVLVKDGPLTALLQQQVTNVEVRIHPEMPIIYRALFTPKGILKFLSNYRKCKVVMKQLHRERSFDLAYINTLSCSFLLPIVRALRIKAFVHVHEILEKPALVAKVTARLCNRYANTVLCVSGAVEENLIRLQPKIKAKTIRIHNGIQPIQIESYPNKELTIRKRMQFYVFGRIMPKKGQWYLLEALKLLPSAYRGQAQFVLVGGTPPGQEHLSEALCAQIAENGLESTVTLKGFCNDISEEMSKADVCIVPSLMRDPFPTTVLEAMSARKPVIATNHGGAAEAIEDRENGLLVPPHAPQMLANAIAYAIENPAVIKLLGERAFETYTKRFTLEVFQKNWRQLHASGNSQFENYVSNIEGSNNEMRKNSGVQVLEQNF